MAKVMMSVTVTQGAPTPEDIERQLALPAGTLDRQFGVVEVDDLRHEYAISVEEAAVPLVRSAQGLDVSGPFSNPKIDTFGPPQ
jgi:hypothetical protein